MIYDPLTADKGDWVLLNDATIIFSTDGMTPSGNSKGYSQILKNKPVTIPYTIEVTVTKTGRVSLSGSTTIDQYTEVWDFTRWENSWYELSCDGTIQRNRTISMSVGDIFKTILTTTGAIGYLNNTQKCTVTGKSLSGQHYPGFRIPYNVGYTVKDLKIKPYSEV